MKAYKAKGTPQVMPSEFKWLSFVHSVFIEKHSTQTSFSGFTV